MAWYFVYDLTTGARCGTLNTRLDDAIYAAQGRGQIEYPDNMNTDGMIADVTQNPPILIPDSGGGK